MKRSERSLRPMELLDILDGMFDIYKSNLVTLIGIVAVVFAPLQTLGILARLKWASQSELAGMIVGVANLALILVASFLVMAPSTLAISEAYLGRKISIWAAYRRMLPRLPAFIGTYLLYIFTLAAPLLIAIIVIVGAVALAALALKGNEVAMIISIVAGIFMYLAAILAMLGLYACLLFTCPAFVNEDKRYVAALKRSWNLVRGYFWRTLGIVLLAGLIVTTVESAIDAPLLVATGAWKTMFAAAKGATNEVPFAWYSVGAMIVSIALQPVLLIATILLYYDLRIRKEGYDLQVLAAEMGYREPERTEQIPAYSPVGEPRPVEAEQPSHDTSPPV